jgi:hypothetical protein
MITADEGFRGKPNQKICLYQIFIKPLSRQRLNVLLKLIDSLGGFASLVSASERARDRKSLFRENQAAWLLLLRVVTLLLRE